MATPTLQETTQAIMPEAYPLSHMQQGMLFHSVSEAGSDVYVEQLTCELRGSLDSACFQWAWEQLLRRHAVLRTAFAWHGLPEPLQVVGPRVRLPLEILDWTGLAQDERQTKFASLWAAERKTPFALGRAPLLRMKLIREGPDTHRMMWTWHHIILDAWSVPILLAEFFQAYAARLRGEEPDWEPVRPFRDFVTWQRGIDLAEAERYWRGVLRGFTEPTPIGIGGPPQDAASAYGVQVLDLPIAESDALRSAAKHSRVTVNTFLQSAWAVLLSRYSGCEDVLFGAAVSARPPELAGIEEMVGLLINTLPVRVTATPQCTAADLIRRVQATQIASARYEQTPLLKLQGWSDVPRGTQLFDTLLVCENFPLDASRLHGGGLEMAAIEFAERANFPLTVSMTIREQPRLLVCYQQERFDRAGMVQLLGHLRALLRGMAEGLERPLCELDYLSHCERSQLLEWSRRPERLTRGPALPIHRLFEAVAAELPAAPAVTFATAHEEYTLSYAELNGKGNAFARDLRARGIGVEDRVAICMEPSLARIVAMIGAMKAGAAYVSLETASPDAMLRDLIADCGASLVLVDPGAESRFAGPGMPPALAPEDGFEEQQNLEGGAAPENLAYLIYTSGSTGKPKGVAVTHASLRHLVEAEMEALRITRKSRVLQFASWSFDASVWEIFATLLAGARLYLAPRRLLVPSRDLIALMDRCAISVVTLPPSVLSAMPSAPLPALTTIVSGGEACTAELVDRWAPGRRFLNAYGPTECTVCATIGEASPAQGTPSIGRPFGDSRIYILDSSQQPTPIGVAGELFLGGPSVARGYWNRPELTEAAFLPDPFAGVPESRMYRTGDTARFLANGEIEYLGRRDQQVKIRGIRIELGEIETVLRQDPTCREVAVEAIGKGTSGEKSLIAYIVPQDGIAFDAVAVKERLRRRLPEHMIPSHLVALERFPLMPSGKLDRRALPAPERSFATDATRAAAPPRNDAERVIAEIWRDILDLPGVGVQTNFFDQGGHSLQLLQVQDRLREKLGIEVPVTDLFKYPTVESLAAHLRRQKDGTASDEQQDASRRARARQEAMALKLELKAQAKGRGKQMKETLKAALKHDLKSVFEKQLREAGDV